MAGPLTATQERRHRRQLQRERADAATAAGREWQRQRRPSRVAVLAVDPGTHFVGLVALGHDGRLLDWLEWAIAAGTPGERLSDVETGLALAIRLLRPDVVAYERGRGKHRASLLDVVIDEIPALCRRAGVPAQGYQVSEWRQIAVGRGNAGKEYTARILHGSYPDLAACIPHVPRYLDVWDAAGVAKCWWELRFQRKIDGRAAAVRRDQLATQLSRKAGGHAGVRAAGGMAALMRDR